jgi:hypothetical protein
MEAIAEEATAIYQMQGASGTEPGELQGPSAEDRLISIRSCPLGLLAHQTNSTGSLIVWSESPTWNGWGRTLPWVQGH